MLFLRVSTTEIGSELSAANAQYLLPVGFPVGFTPLQSDTEGEYQPVVRLAGELLGLTVDMQQLWWQARFRMTQRSLLEWASREASIDHAENLIEALLQAGLLYPLTAENALEFMRRHTILPNGIGTGYSADDDIYLIRDHSMKPILGVDDQTYSVWMMADGIHSIESICRGVADEKEVSYAPLATVIAGTVPALIQQNVIFIDRMS